MIGSRRPVDQGDMTAQTPQALRRRLAALIENEQVQKAGRFPKAELKRAGPIYEISGALEVKKAEGGIAAGGAWLVASYARDWTAAIEELRRAAIEHDPVRGERIILPGGRR